MMRICVIANPNSIHTQRWVRYFANRGFEVHLIGDKPLAGAPPPGAILHDLTRETNVRKLRYLVWARATRRIVRDIQPDVLHAHQVASAGWLGAATGYHPFIVTSWGSDLLIGARRSTVQRQLARWVLSRADYVTCVSESLAQAALALGADSQRVELVPWGVDRDIFHPAINEGLDTTSHGRMMDGDSSESLGEAPLVLSIRAVRPLYNLPIIVRAIPAVLDQVPAAKFVVRTYSVDSSLLAEVRSQIEVAGVSGAVKYVGDLPDDYAIAKLYRRAAVVVSVPSSDGTPQSVLEAMACGAVPVLSDLPWLQGWVQNEREALVVPVGDAKALARAIVRLLTDATLHERLRAAALTLVRNRADSALWMAQSEAIYTRMAEAAHRSSRGKT